MIELVFDMNGAISDIGRIWDLHPSHGGGAGRMM